MHGSEPLILDISLKLLRDGKAQLPTAALLWHFIERCLSNVYDASPAERTATRQWLGQLALWMLWGAPAVMKHRKEQTVWQVPASSLEPPFSPHRPASYPTVPLVRRQALAL